MSSVTILFSMLANHQSRHQATRKVVVSLVIAVGHFNLPQGLGHILANIG